MPLKKSSGSADHLFQNIAAGKPPRISLDGERRAAARRWFRDQALQVQRVDTNNFINKSDKDRKFRTVSNENIGEMFTFSYDAKLKDKLPYWDRFPLVFVIQSYGDGFLGINLHYLPPRFRSVLMDAMYRTVNNSKYDNTTKLMISYEILKGAAKYRYFKPCVKRYLFNRVASKFMKISANEWDMALMLPTERFQKKRKSFVWEESIAQLNGENG